LRSPPERNGRDFGRGRDRDPRDNRDRGPPPRVPSYDRWRAEKEREAPRGRGVDGDPAFVPRNFLFDDRNEFHEEGSNPEESRVRKRDSSPDRWGHDRFEREEGDTSSDNNSKESGSKADGESGSAKQSGSGNGGNGDDASKGDKQDGEKQDKQSQSQSQKDADRSGSPARDASGSAAGDD